MQSNLERQAGLHVAIIMDGNGRWGTRRGLPRTAGHRAGVDAVRRVVEAAPGLGIGTLTVFGFSSANWRRPEAEVCSLMSLFSAISQSRARGARRKRHAPHRHRPSRPPTGGPARRDRSRGGGDGAGEASRSAHRARLFLARCHRQCGGELARRISLLPRCRFTRRHVLRPLGPAHPPARR